MLTITIFAAGLVCLAGVLGLRLWRAQAQVSTVAAQASADERGITLQTLIVTAVLVLMAVAAGVVIVAITNNAADDLEQAAPTIESGCVSHEIFDPILAGQGAFDHFGAGDAKQGSAVGCVPVCFETTSRTNGGANHYSLGSQTERTPLDGKPVPRGGAYTTTGAGTGSDPYVYVKVPEKDWETPAVSDKVSPHVSNEWCYTETDSNGNPVQDSAYFYDRP